MSIVKWIVVDLNTFGSLESTQLNYGTDEMCAIADAHFIFLINPQMKKLKLTLYEQPQQQQQPIRELDAHLFSIKQHPVFPVFPLRGREKTEKEMKWMPQADGKHFVF